MNTDATKPNADGYYADDANVGSDELDLSFLDEEKKDDK